MSSWVSPVRNFVLLAALLFQSGCAVPLGPGFGHRSRSVESTALASTPPPPGALALLQVTDTLRNTGNRGLTYLDFDLTPAVDRSRLKVSIDGREAHVSGQGPQPDAPWRVNFEHGWPRGENRTIRIAYDLRPEASDDGLVAVASDGTCVADRSIFPVWRKPEGVLASGDAYAHTRTMVFTVPDGFRVLAAGGRRRVTRSANGLRYEFRASALEAPPYVVEGRYQEQRVRTAHGEMIFWTFQPLDPSAAQAAADRLMTTAATFDRTFGQLHKYPQPFYVVESPAPESPSAALASAFAASFPQGVLLDRSAFTQGLASEPVLEAVETSLARIWFGWYGEPAAEARILLGRGMGLFAVALAAEARGGDAARRREIARLLGAYTLADAHAAGQPLLNIPPRATREQQSTDAYRAALFWAALEDQAGRENFAAALRRYWTAMKGQPLDVPELRSALEAAAGRDLAATFREWLGRPGLPDDFRARYAAQP